MKNRTAITRHNRRANPHGIPAADLIAGRLTRTRPAAPVTADTQRLLLPGLRPTLTAGSTR